jgi:DMSO/TMAO reductase YedYZ molybdopterin-dependent catalytic subunit
MPDRSSADEPDVSHGSHGAESHGPADLVERRQRYIQRQIEMNNGDVDVRFRGELPRGSGPANRHGMPRLPVGQHEVKNWPVLDLGEQPQIDMSRWKLEVGGLVEHPMTFSWDQFLALPQVDDVSDFHCVTTWSRYDNHWRGVRFRTIAELVVPKVEARYVLCTSYDFMPGSVIPYTTNLPLARAIEDDVLLVHAWEGRPLPPEHGGPLRMITPKLYAWKGAKWILKIEFLAEDHKGFWEVRGYSNSAEPWHNDRYSTD